MPKPPHSPLAGLPPILAERREFSISTLAAVKEKLNGSTELRSAASIAIYATGSFARGEASRYSDIDLFFIDKSGILSGLSQILIKSDLIRFCRQLALPDFSGDGEYLQFHDLEQMQKELGSRKDDFQNHFTARLLLILESAPLWNEEVYKHAIEGVVASYYRDYHDHVANFRPIFLANDILRYWKTLCLNYEHRRNRPTDDNKAKNRNHLKNLKLKFSRMATCFSTVTALAKDRAVDPESLMELIRLPPLARLERAATECPGGISIYREMMVEYAWFLEVTGKTPDDSLAWISELDNRKLAFAKAEAFGEKMFQLLLRSTSDGGILRYLVI